VIELVRREDWRIYTLMGKRSARMYMPVGERHHALPMHADVSAPINDLTCKGVGGATNQTHRVLNNTLSNRD
jgi:hypothetical protein